MKQKTILVFIVGILALSLAGDAFDFPAAKTKARAGEYVLAPSMEAAEISKDSAVIYYSRTMVTPGITESTIKSPFKQFKMPNSLLIAIPKGQIARKGDIVLTWWQSGSGMMRAYVVNASNPREPVVCYLDDGKKQEKIKTDSFVKISEMLTPGASIGFWDDSWRRWNHATLINVSEGKAIVVGFGGKMSIHNLKDCLPVPVSPKVKVGDEVYVLEFSSFKKAAVKKVDYNIGFVTTDSGKTVAFCDVLNPVQAAQILLKKLGFNPGNIDGILGKETDGAIRKFQKKNGLAVDGKASLELVQILHKKTCIQ